MSQKKAIKNVAYCRVSNRNPSDDIDNQIEFIQNHVNGKNLVLDEIISDIGSELNYKRKKWNKLIDGVMNNEIDTIYITYKDRFIRIYGLRKYKRYRMIDYESL
ncbi:recombinase family protein [Macrococcus canis]|uniref:recombinase family protein n=1 Tax=Macrococcoides canis TaxID=1855823 RepID=UPI00207CC6AB|nr:recombinase family protein [Macrococcus canis]